MSSPSGLEEVDAEGFRAALAASGGQPVLVDYYAPDCIWCERLEPVLVAAQDAWRNRVRFVKVNARSAPETLPGNGIRGTPTVALYRDGQLVMTKAGMIQRPALDVFLTHWLDAGNAGLSAG